MNKYLFSFLIILFIVTSCDNNNDDTEPIVLSENIELYNEDLISDDYIFVVENSSTYSYLINKEGYKLWEWNFDTTSGNDLEILENGNIIGLFKAPNPSIDFGGFGGTAKLIDSNGNTIWEFTVSDENFIAHHDVEMLPNGNVLMMVWERITNQTAVQNGVDFNTDIFAEKIIEVNPSNNQIVWEWRSWDHIIQDKFEDLPNFGDVNMNPNKININYSIDNPPGGSFFINGDIMHANGLDYDPINDVIYLSVNYYDEIWVIDHSTTTAEAQSDTGGNYNHGGDLIYRFGNPNTYNSLGNKIFDKNHFPNLLEDGVPGEGNVLVYVNGNSTEQSVIYELAMPSNFRLESNFNNEPNIVWSYLNDEIHSDKLCGAIRLPNGNTVITESDYGLWEVTENGEIAWKYLKDETANFIWRSYHYPRDGAVSQSLGLNQD